MTDATDPAPVLSREEVEHSIRRYDQATGWASLIDHKWALAVLRSHETLRAERDALAGEVERLREGRG
jgi:hypothetical protein